MSNSEELAGRREDFNKLQPGCLFDLGIRRWFIFIETCVQDSECVIVIELTPSNRQKIIDGLPPNRTTLSFKEMLCLNLRND
jgi:hypothetical protein